MHPLDKIFEKTERTPLEKCIVEMWYKTGDRAFCETAAEELARYEAMENKFMNGDFILILPGEDDGTREWLMDKEKMKDFSIPDDEYRLEYRVTLAKDEYFSIVAALKEG